MANNTTKTDYVDKPGQKQSEQNLNQKVEFGIELNMPWKETT